MGEYREPARRPYRGDGRVERDPLAGNVIRTVLGEIPVEGLLAIPDYPPIGEVAREMGPADHPVWGKGLHPRVLNVEPVGAHAVGDPPIPLLAIRTKRGYQRLKVDQPGGRAYVEPEPQKVALARLPFDVELYPGQKANAKPTRLGRGLRVPGEGIVVGQSEYPYPGVGGVRREIRG